MKESLGLGNTNNIVHEYPVGIGLNKRLNDMIELKPFEKEIVMYLMDKKVFYTYQVTQEVIRDLNNINQIGIGSIKKFLTRLKGLIVYEVVREFFTPEEWDELEISKLWKCSLEYISGSENMYIETLFNQAKLLRFKEFCREKDIVQIKDITLDLLEEFKYYDGVGKKKFTEVLSALLKYISLKEDTSAHELFLSKEIIFNTQILEKFGTFTVREIKDIFGKSSVFYGVETLKIKDIHKKSMSELDGNVNYLELEHLISIINNSYSFSELCARGDEVFSKTEEVLRRRYVDRHTLKEIGAEYAISKERVRQLEQLGIERINLYMEKSMLLTYLKTLYKGNAIDQTILSEHIGEGNEYVLEMINSNDITGIVFVKEFNKYLLVNVEKYIQWRENLKDSLPDKFEWDDYKNRVCEQLISIGLPGDDDELSLSLIEGLGYQRYGTFIKYGHITIHELVEYMFLNDFTEAFALNEVSFKKIREYALDKYSFHIDSNIKSFEGRIRSVKEIILVGKRTYKHIEHINYPNELHELIKCTLSNISKSRESVNTVVIFNELKDKIYKYDVNNKYYLYSLIKYYFSDICTAGEGNTLNIYFGNNVEHFKREDDLFKYIKNKKGSISKREILDELDWESYKLEDILCKSKKIIPWDNQTFIKVEDFEEKEILDHIINEMCQQIHLRGYTTAYTLLNEVMSEPSKRSVFEKNNIDAPFKLAALIKKADDAIKGHKNFLHHINSEVSNIDALIATKFNVECENFVKEDLINFLIEMGYSPVSAKNKYLQLKNKKVR